VVTTAFAPLAPGATTEAMTACLKEAYEGRAFVRVLAPGEMVDSKRTRGSNVVELQIVADARTGTAIVIGALDNLVKGAAGQAVQAFNLCTAWTRPWGSPPWGCTRERDVPQGFRAAGWRGPEALGSPDLGLLVGDPGTTVAGPVHDEPCRRRPVHLSRGRIAGGLAGPRSQQRPRTP
jgi:hypothetical protein